MNPWEIQGGNTNPYMADYDSGMTQAYADSSQAYDMGQQAQKQAGSLINQYNVYSQQSAAPGSSYPTFPNPYGLGSQQAFSQGSAVVGSESAPTFNQSTVGDNSGMISNSTSINPWNFSGPSNAR